MSARIALNLICISEINPINFSFVMNLNYLIFYADAHKLIEIGEKVTYPLSGSRKKVDTKESGAKKKKKSNKCHLLVS